MFIKEFFTYFPLIGGGDHWLSSVSFLTNIISTGNFIYDQFKNLVVINRVREREWAQNKEKHKKIDIEKKKKKTEKKKEKIEKEIEIETMNIIYSCNEDDYYDNIDNAGFVNTYGDVKDYFPNYYGYFDDDERIYSKRRMIEQWRM